MASDRLAVSLPRLASAERQGQVAVLRLNRAQKRNALDDETVLGHRRLLQPTCRTTSARCVLAGEGEHFSAGLDLSELKERDVAQGIAHSGTLAPRLREDPIRQGAGRRGAARRGGRRRARTRRRRACARRRALGLLRAAGRQPRHLCRRRRLGAAAAADRRRAHDGHDADRPHLFGRRRPGHGAHAHIWSSPARGFAKGLELAQRIAGNAPLTNFAVMHALPRIAEMRPGAGYAMEALIAGDRAGRPRGESAAQGLSREARAEGDAHLRRRRRARYRCPGQQ